MTAKKKKTTKRKSAKKVVRKRKQTDPREYMGLPKRSRKVVLEQGSGPGYMALALAYGKPEEKRSKHNYPSISFHVEYLEVEGTDEVDIHWEFEIIDTRGKRKWRKGTIVVEDAELVRNHRLIDSLV